MTSTERRELYRIGIDRLHALQAMFHVRERPKRKAIRRLVDQLVIESGLEGDKRERYYRLLATCALLNREPLHSNWNRKRRK